MSERRSAVPESSAVAPKKAVRRGARGGATDHLFLRLDSTTKLVIIGKAREAGKSTTAYLIEAATGAAPIRARRAPTVNAELLARTLAELNKIGSNINQIAKAANSHGRVEDRTHLQATLAELKQTRSAVLAALNMDGAGNAE